jgi:uncharacterized protein YaiL (DUF2058 family)
VTKLQRIVAYGAGVLLIVAGAVCAAAIGGETGSVLATLLIGLGMVGLVGLVFMEVGLSEDRERERERRRAERANEEAERAKRERAEREQAERAFGRQGLSRRTRRAFRPRRPQ